jgi:hypothetical protein
MPLARLTKEITFNLKDRGYQYNGHDQSHIDMTGLINLINSPHVQEQVKNGILYGYYGHEIRQLYGMIPPETVVINGKTIRIEPCCRTHKIHADRDGTVTYQQEFLQNEAGEHALTNYKAKIGGFSHSFRSLRSADGSLKTVMFGGMDYTRAPNFADNLANGAMADTFNSLIEGQTLFDVNPTIAALMEQRIYDNYNNIQSELMTQSLLLAQQEEITRSQAELEALKKQRKARILRQTERQEDIYASMLCPTRPFSEVLDESNAFLAAKVEEKRQEEEASGVIERSRGRGFSGLFGG